MALKPESESETAHRIFKWYKATGEFPSDQSKLECYYLLSKYNYFIANNIDKNIMKALLDACNILLTNRIVLVFGDFLLEELFFGLKAYNFKEHDEVKVIYIDAHYDLPEILMANAIGMSSHYNKTFLYVIDNVEALNKESVNFVLKAKEKLMDSNKYIICCSLLFNKVNAVLRSKIRKVRLGTHKADTSILKRLIFALFTEKDREKAYSMFMANGYGLKYVLSLAVHNLPHFYRDSDNAFKHNLKILEKSDSTAYKVADEVVLKYFVYNFITTDKKVNIRFPDKIAKVTTTTKKSKVASTPSKTKTKHKFNKTKGRSVFNY